MATSIESASIIVRLIGNPLASSTGFTAAMPGTPRSSSMFLTLWPFIVLLLGALLIGTTFAHILEMPAKLSLDGPEWVHLQQRLYRTFASVGGAVEIAAIVCATVYAYLLRDQRTALTLAVCGTVFLVVAFIVWLSMTAPVNAKVLRWNPDAIPAGWEMLRTRWEYSHAIRFVIHLIGVSALIGAALIRR
jgi:hypothetical protein